MNASLVIFAQAASRTHWVSAPADSSRAAVIARRCTPGAETHWAIAVISSRWVFLLQWENTSSSRWTTSSTWLLLASPSSAARSADSGSSPGKVVSTTFHFSLPGSRPARSAGNNPARMSEVFQNRLDQHHEQKLFSQRNRSHSSMTCLRPKKRWAVDSEYASRPR